MNRLVARSSSFTRTHRSSASSPGASAHRTIIVRALRSTSWSVRSKHASSERPRTMAEYQPSDQLTRTSKA